MKKILVFGEFSGYGKSLVKGFRGLGFKADSYSFLNDGWKNIGGDFSLKEGGMVFKFFQLIKLMPIFFTYDIVLIMNPKFVGFKNLGFFIITLMRVFNKKIILLCAGDDVEYIRYGLEGKIENWTYADCGVPDNKYFMSYSDRFINYITALCSSYIVPSMYDYAKAWQQTQFKTKMTETIPLACDGDSSGPIKELEEKLVIFHGINRAGVKGTDKIIKAMNIIKSRYPEKVELIIVEKLAYEHYMKVLNRADVIIDQTKSNSYGMNAIYSMLQGKVVLAPANNYFKRDLGIDFCPIFSIENSVDSIVHKLDYLVNNRTEINSIKQNTRCYAQRIHEPKKVAKQLLNAIGVQQ